MVGTRIPASAIVDYREELFPIDLTVDIWNPGKNYHCSKFFSNSSFLVLLSCVCFLFEMITRETDAICKWPQRSELVQIIQLLH